MTPTKVFYSEDQRVVLIEGSRSFTPGSGALTAAINPSNSDEVIVTYDTLINQSGQVKQVLGPINYASILDEAGSPAGANAADVVTYLNGEFVKGPDEQTIDSPAAAFTNQSYLSNPQIKFSENRSLVGGKYKITLSMVAWSAAANRSVIARLFIDGSPATPLHSKEPKVITDRPWPSRTFEMDFTAGSHNFELRYGRGIGGGPSLVAVQDVIVTFKRVGP